MKSDKVSDIPSASISSADSGDLMFFGKVGNAITRVTTAIAAARDHLFSIQHEDGYWCGELEADTTLESDYILLHALLGTSWLLRPSALAGRRLPRLRLLDRLRAEARRVVLPQADPDGIVRVSSTALAQQAASWPAWISPPGSVACYVQARSHMDCSRYDESSAKYPGAVSQ